MQSKSTTVCVIGLGYVGLPLAIQFARCGAKVIGLDIDAAKVEQINAGQSYIKHIASETIGETLRNDHLRASTDFARVGEGDAVIICVPSPLNKNREPDISYIVDTGRMIAPYMRKGTLVVLVAPKYPGTYEETLR